MKKSVLFILILFYFTPAFFWGLEEKEDMIVLFDTSVSVLPVYDLFSGRLIQELVGEHLSEGDSFHLLSFDSEPHFEFTLPMIGSNEEERIVSYISLLKPMGQHTDLISALNFLYKFTKDLPLNTTKKILILSDGIHDPPPSSPLYGKDSDYVEKEITDITGKIYREGWNVHLLKIPGVTSKGTDNTLSNSTGNSSDEKAESVSSFSSAKNEDITNENNEENLMSIISGELGTTAVEVDESTDNISNVAMGNVHLSIIEVPSETDYSLSIKCKAVNYGPDVFITTLREVLLNDQNILSKKIKLKLKSSEDSVFSIPLIIPASIPSGDTVFDLDFIFSEGADITPGDFSISTTLIENVNDDSSELPVGLILLITLIIVIIILTIIFIRRKIEKPATEYTSKDILLEQGISETDTPAEIASKGYGSTAALKTDSSSATATSSVKRKGVSETVSSHEHFVSNYSETSESGKSRQKASKKVEDSQHHHGRAAVNIPEEKAHLAVEMHVIGQNPYSGSRNVEIVDENASVRIGNKHDQFSIFIINIPRHIADISFNGKKYRFTPVLKEYFPEISTPLEDCIGEYIKVVDDKGRQTRIVFRKYLPPLAKINRILHLTDKPGLPDFRY